MSWSMASGALMRSRALAVQRSFTSRAAGMLGSRRVWEVGGGWLGASVRLARGSVVARGRRSARRGCR